MSDVMKTIDAKGLLFIGDVHLTSNRPSRRRDNYQQAILFKLEQCCTIANRDKLIPIFTGDIFHQPKELDEGLKTKLLRVLKQFWTTPYSNVGNHDIISAKLSDSDSLAMIGESGVLNVCAQSGPAFEARMRDVKKDREVIMGIGFTPYAQSLPSSVEGFFPNAEKVFWVTHHDMAFENLPFSNLEPFEITGCQAVINGHIHNEQKEKIVGGTIYFNFGSLTRTKTDQLNHQPCVWSFVPGLGFERHRLAIEKDVFDLTTRMVDEKGEVVDVSEMKESLFVKLLQDAENKDVSKTAEGEYIMDAIQDMFKKKNTPDNVQAVVLSLLKGVTKVT